MVRAESGWQLAASSSSWRAASGRPEQHTALHGTLCEAAPGVKHERAGAAVIITETLQILISMKNPSKDNRSWNFNCKPESEEDCRMGIPEFTVVCAN